MTTFPDNTNATAFDNLNPMAGQSAFMPPPEKEEPKEPRKPFEFDLDAETVFRLKQEEIDLLRELADEEGRARQQLANVPKDRKGSHLVTQGLVYAQTRRLEEKIAENRRVQRRSLHPYLANMTLDEVKDFFFTPEGKLKPGPEQVKGDLGLITTYEEGKPPKTFDPYAEGLGPKTLAASGRPEVQHLMIRGRLAQQRREAEAAEKYHLWREANPEAAKREDRIKEMMDLTWEMSVAEKKKFGPVAWIEDQLSGLRESSEKGGANILYPFFGDDPFVLEALDEIKNGEIDLYAGRPRTPLELATRFHDPEGWSRKIGNVAGSSLLSAAMVVGGKITAIPVLSTFGLMGLGEGLSEYDRVMREAGMTPDDAERWTMGVGYAIAEVGMEAIGAGVNRTAAKLIGNAKAKEVGEVALKEGGRISKALKVLSDKYKIKALAAGAITEGGEEFLTQVAHNMIRNHYDPEKKWYDASAFDGGLDAFILGTLGGAFVGPAIYAKGKSVEKKKRAEINKLLGQDIRTAIAEREAAEAAGKAESAPEMVAVAPVDPEELPEGVEGGVGVFDDNTDLLEVFTYGEGKDADFATKEEAQREADARAEMRNQPHAQAAMDRGEEFTPVYETMEMDPEEIQDMTAEDQSLAAEPVAQTTPSVATDATQTEASNQQSADVVEAKLRESAGLPQRNEGEAPMVRVIGRKEEREKGQPALLKRLRIMARRSGRRVGKPLRIVQVEVDPKLAFDGLYHDGVIYVDASLGKGPKSKLRRGEKAFTRQVYLRIVGHEMVHGARKISPELYNHLVGSMSDEQLGRTLRQYQKRLGRDRAEAFAQLPPDVLLEEALATAAEEELGRIGAGRSSADQGLISQFVDYLRSVSAKYGFKGRFAQDLDAVVRQMADGKTLDEISLPTRAPRRARVKKDVADQDRTIRVITPVTKEPVGDDEVVEPTDERPMMSPVAEPEITSLTAEDVRNGVMAEPGVVLDEEIDSSVFDFVVDTGMRLSPTARIPKISLSKFRGKSAFAFFADRMKVGNYPGLDPASGISIPLQGGAGYPFIKGQKGKAGWAFTALNVATTFLNRVNATDGIGLVTLFNRENLMGNATFLKAYFAELDWAIRSGRLTEDEILVELNNKRSTALNTDVVAKQEKAKWVDLWRVSWDTLAQAQDALAQSTFEVRRSAMFGWNETKVGNNKGSKIGADALVARGFPNLTKMVEMMEEPKFRSLDIGTVVAAIQFTKGQDGAVAAQDLGIVEHDSYPVVVEGNGLGWVDKPVDILKYIKDPKILSKARPQAIRSISMKMPPLRLSPIPAYESEEYWQAAGKAHPSMKSMSGHLLNLYHGSPSAEPFFKFDPDRVGSTTDSGFLGRGFYFTPHESRATRYREAFKEVDAEGFPVGEGQLMTVNLLIENPLVINQEHIDEYEEFEQSAFFGRAGEILDPDNPRSFMDRWANMEPESFEERDLINEVTDRLMEAGYDGVVLDPANDDFREYVAFNETSVKSATDNVGTYGQREPTAEESAQLGMTEDEAAVEQMLGDIRLSPAPPVQSPAFRRWFKNSEIVNDQGEPQLAFHGTKQEFTEFRPRFDDGLMFFTLDSQFASDWMRGVGGPRQPSDEVISQAEEMRAYEEQLFDEMGIRDIDPSTDAGLAAYDQMRQSIRDRMVERFGFGSATEYGGVGGTRVMPVYLSVQKLFDPRKHWNLIDFQTPSEAWIESAKRGNWLVYEKDRIVDQIKALGFDGMLLSESGLEGSPLNTVAIFDPTQVKSATANVGTYDPSSPDIRLSPVRPAEISIDDIAGDDRVAIGAVLQVRDRKTNYSEWQEEMKKRLPDLTDEQLASIWQKSILLANYIVDDSNTGASRKLLDQAGRFPERTGAAAVPELQTAVDEIAELDPEEAAGLRDQEERIARTSREDIADYAALKRQIRLQMRSASEGYRAGVRTERERSLAKAQTRIERVHARLKAKRSLTRSLEREFNSAVRQAGMSSQKFQRSLPMWIIRREFGEGTPQQRTNKMMEAIRLTSKAFDEFQKDIAHEKLNKSIKALTKAKLRPTFDETAKAIMEEFGIGTRNFPTNEKQMLRSIVQMLARMEEAGGDVRLPPEIALKIRDLSHLGTQEVSDLSFQDAMDLNDAIRFILHLNRISNQLIGEQRRVEYQESRNRIQEEIRKRLKLRRRLGFEGRQDKEESSGVIHHTKNIWSKTMLLMPDRFALWISGTRDSETYQRLYVDLADGQSQMLGQYQSDKDFLEDHLRSIGIDLNTDEGKEEIRRMSLPMSNKQSRISALVKGDKLGRYSRWAMLRSGPGARSDVYYHDITLESGKTIRITGGERIALLCHFADLETRASIAKGSQMRIDDMVEFSLTSEDMRNIEDMHLAVPEGVEQTRLNRERQIADAMLERINGSMRNAMREYSVEHVGYDITKGHTYFPRRRYLGAKQVDEVDAGRFYNQSLDLMGITKERVANTKPIILGDAFSVYNNHSYQVAGLRHLAAPIRNAHNLLNDETMIRFLRGSKQGRKIIEYYRDLLNDLAVEVSGTKGPSAYKQRDPANSLATAVARNLTVGALGVNPRVMFYQVASLAAASSDMDATLILKGAQGMAASESTREMSLHSPYLRERFSSERYGLVSEGLTERPTSALVKDKTWSDWFMGGIAKFDELALRAIWGGAKIEVRERIKRGELNTEVGSEAYWIAVSQRAEQVVKRTQPTMDIMHMSGMARRARREGNWLRLITMFASQRHKNINMQAEMLLMVQTGQLGKASKGMLTHTILQPIVLWSMRGLYASSVGAGMASLWDLLLGEAPEDEEEELHWLSSLVDHMIAMNFGNYPLGDFPGVAVRTIAGDVAGYEPETFTPDLSPVLSQLERTMGSISRAYSAVRKQFDPKEEATAEDLFWSIFNASADLSTMAGFPTHAFREIAKPIKKRTTYLDIVTRRRNLLMREKRELEKDHKFLPSEKLAELETINAIWPDISKFVRDAKDLKSQGATDKDVQGLMDAANKMAETIVGLKNKE